MRTSAEKQFDLVKLKTIALATLDYLVENPENALATKEEDPKDDFYQHLKVQTEKYFQQRRIDRLQHRLSHFFDILIGRVDLNFANYIKDKTGYEIDLLEGLQNRVKILLSKKEINTQKEANDISLLLNYYNRTTSNKDDIEKCNALLVEYHERMSPVYLKKKRGYTETITVEEKDGVEITSITIYTGSKPT